MLSTTVSCSHIPDDILIQILKELPVKSLIRFRSISKTWYAIITRPSFISTHMHRSIITNKKNYSFLCVEQYSSENPIPFKSLYSFVQYNDIPAFPPTKIPFADPFAVGQCNGLVCFTTYEEKLVLCNLFIGRVLNIPVPIFPYESQVILGFGFDMVTEDYKIVRILHSYVDEEKERIEYQLYALKERQWRKIDYSRCHGPLEHYTYSLYLEGAIHRIFEEDEANGKHYLESFDMASEKFSIMTLPPSCTRSEDFDIWLSSLDDCICVSHEKDMEYNIWVMKRFGLAESWTKLYTIDLQPIKLHMRSRCIGEVIKIEKDGRIALVMDFQDILLYDPRTQQTSKLKQKKNSLFIGACTESLMLLNEKENDAPPNMTLDLFS